MFPFLRISPNNMFPQLSMLALLASCALVLNAVAVANSVVGLRRRSTAISGGMGYRTTSSTTRTSTPRTRSSLTASRTARQREKRTLWQIEKGSKLCTAKGILTHILPAGPEQISKPILLCMRRKQTRPRSIGSKRSSKSSLLGEVKMLSLQKKYEGTYDANITRQCEENSQNENDRYIIPAFNPSPHEHTSP